MTEEEILEATAAVLARRPAATMEELARAAGVSRATLFRRYPSRAELVADLSRRALDAYVQDVDRAEPERGPAAEALRRVLAHLVALAPRYGLLALQPLEAVVEDRLLEQARSTEDRLRALVRRGQEAGEFRVDLPADWCVVAVTWLIVGAADGLRTGRVAPADVERLVAETVLGALRRR